MSKKWRKIGLGLSGLTLTVLWGSGCNGPGGASLITQPGAYIAPGGSGQISNDETPGTPPVPGDGHVGKIPQYTTAVLLYEGDGVASAEAQQVESILAAANVGYKIKSSSQINSMSAAEWGTYGMMYVPGGLGATMSNSLSSTAIGRIQSAVKAGMGYVGICAGAFLAGDYGSWGLALAPFDFDYYIAEYQGITRASVTLSFPSGSPNGTEMEQIWYGGPKLDGFGSVVARYSNNTVAIAEDQLGDGFMILVSTHPDAPSSWRSGTSIRSTVAENSAYVVTLVNAALKHQPLPSF
jgi:hypothetical protein